MPTNQSSPWSGGNLRTCSGVDAGALPKTGVATKVPFGQTSLEVPRRKDQAKPPASLPASSTSPPRPTVVTPPAVSVWEDRDENKTITQSQFTVVPRVSLNMPQQLNGFQNSNQILKQAGSIISETRALSPKKECQFGSNVQLNVPVQNYMTPQACQTGTSLPVSRCRGLTGDTQVGSEPFLSIQDLFIKGQPSLQQSNTLMVSTNVSESQRFRWSFDSNIRSWFKTCWDTKKKWLNEVL